MNNTTITYPIYTEEDECSMSLKAQYELKEFIDSRIKEELRELIHEEVLKALKEYEVNKNGR